MYDLKHVVCSLLVGLVVYVFLEIILHKTVKLNNKAEIQRDKLKISWKWLSIGYACANYYKGDSKDKQRGQLIEIFNKRNLIVSICQLVICLLCIVIPCFPKENLIALFGFSFWRFYSRSLEIILAFGLDVFDKKPKSGTYFNKYGRLKLALKSYLEIYLYSASFYLTLNINNCDNVLLGLKAILMSLSVGTLTNVAYAQTNLSRDSGCGLYNLSDSLQLFPYIQVIATLSLVVLSLTMYISRESDQREPYEDFIKKLEQLKANP